MARIRSIHPGLFTDEAFMELSPHAQIFTIGLWTEADDNGVFAWKPKTLKARILPAAMVDAEDLLAELVAAGAIRQFEADGGVYGAIRNFRRFQRPEKPKAYHPILDELLEYVGLSSNNHSGSDKPCPPVGGSSGISRRPVADQSPTDRRPIDDPSATTPRFRGQMEDGGGSKEEEEPSSLRSDDAASAARQGDPPSAGPASPPPDARTALFREGLDRLCRLTGQPASKARPLLGKMLQAGNDDAAMVSLALAECEATRPADPVPWLKRSIEYRAGKRAPPPIRQRESNLAWMRDDAFAPSPRFDFDGQAEEA